ncbi:glycoside hydrolase family 65 protein [Budviciaceae bacterium BWR-B9]|uniref:Glycoside hydrolase family 65 protein n=1 Tax=Limnobaculum allomyrinae TaxID=2791986 RepID=A0ABS1IPC0_9GAMM|nr:MULTISPECIES: glycoside hydrolase family 65 protein [Limnobaculum]MBK5143618.1 glycoside hydrolase family 65 protein [Limnobaculum allomyrinae]MBV7692634.1 glycoside hydrolase family 65 protein [Limnobaculum sp. M2-1]
MSHPGTLTEHGFDPHFLNKYASLMAGGNGYLGIRASHEEDYTEQVRGMYLAGIYHRATADDINELINLPDIIGMRIELNGEIFSLLAGTIVEYRRELKMKNGELLRDLVWQSPLGGRYHIISRRQMAASPLQLVISQLEITPLDIPCHLQIMTGIDATQTNFGRQHLNETEVRVFEQQYLQGSYRTTDNQQEVVITSYCQLPDNVRSSFSAKNRRLMQHIDVSLESHHTFQMSKISWVASSLDNGYSAETFATDCLNHLKQQVQHGYSTITARSEQCWQTYWQKARVELDSDQPQDQQALDFALYHLAGMTPAHSELCSIAAKGLTGEGYKGHVFWDTEIFLLPFHLLTQPKIARQLLRYRYLHLQQAEEKAHRNGYRGALFPWESAFSGEEETPEFAAINIRTGLRQRVASAIAEHHIVADIAYATVGYYQATHDHDFMRQEGVTLLQKTAEFWLSRATEVNGRWEILNVIGPDEYTEHINNNAYTNYMAHYNVQQALAFMQQYGKIDTAFEIQANDFLHRLYLPEPDDHHVIPQDDSFFSKPTIDLSRYKAHQGSQSILLDYSRAEVNEMQILKQADVIMLLHLLPELFDAQIKAANFAYYEPRTIHDSSLSKAIHAIIASQQQSELAYQLYQQACLIDLGPDPHSSDEGIHAASLGAIWLGALFGFAGLHYQQGELHLNPRLPIQWQQLRFPLNWRGQQLFFTLTQNQIQIDGVWSEPLTIYIAGQAHTITQPSTINRNENNENCYCA